jgi:UDP-N-acetylglucosamine--dolichyl-phosphate N-acetylglucosaminephosphotransferase
VLLCFAAKSFLGPKIFIGDVFCFVFGTLIVQLKFRQRETRDILFFFVPQMINFILSLPQILGFKNCP